MDEVERALRGTRGAQHTGLRLALHLLLAVGWCRGNITATDKHNNEKNDDNDAEDEDEDDEKGDEKDDEKAARRALRRRLAKSRAALSAQARDSAELLLLPRTP